MVRITVSKSKPPKKPTGDPISGTFKGTVTPTDGEAKEVEGSYSGTANAETGEFNVMGILAARGGPGTVTSLTHHGLTFTFSSPVFARKYADNTEWFVVGPVTITNVAIAAGQTTDVFLGLALMVDPADPTPDALASQAFDNRLTALNTYSAALGVSLPLTVDPGSNAKTVWAYRGLDTAASAGGASCGAAIFQLTVEATDRGPTALKPPGLYCAGGKPLLTTANINFNKYPPIAIPAGATEPDWNLPHDKASGANCFLTGPFVQLGKSVYNESICPTDWMGSYAAYRVDGINKMLLGCLSNTARRQEFIIRIVQAGLEVEAGVQLRMRSWYANPGFGHGAAIYRAFAAQWLNNSTMKSKPAVFTDVPGYVPSVPYFTEDGWDYATGPSGAMLFGIYSTAPVRGGNHEFLDATYNLYAPHTFPTFEATVVSATSTTVTIAAPSVTPESGYSIMMVNGPAAGVAKIANWNAGTNTWTLTDTGSINPGPWPATPVAGNTVRYMNGGTYELIVQRAQTGEAIAMVVAESITPGIIADFNSVNFFKGKKDWIDRNGLLDTPMVYGGVSTDRGGNLFGEPTADANQWVSKFYDLVAADWDDLTGA